MDRGTDKWLSKFKFLGWIKNQILLATRLSSRRLAHPWSSAETYLNLHKVGRLENKKDFEIFFAQEIPSE